MPDNPIQLGEGIETRIRVDMWVQAEQASMVMLRNLQFVLGGTGTGRAYSGRRGPSSMPGERPAMQSGGLVNSFHSFVEQGMLAEGGFALHFGVESRGMKYAGQFDPRLTGYSAKPHFAERPFVDEVIALSKAEFKVIFSERIPE